MSSTETGSQGLLRYDRTIGLSTMAGRGFYFPADTAIAKDGRLLVVNRSIAEGGDKGGVRVTKCDLESEYYGTFGSAGDGDGEFLLPTAIALDSVGNVYVSDEHIHRITVFDPSDRFLKNWGEHGTGPGELDGPSGMAFDGEDNLYVADQQNSRIQKFTGDGRPLMSFGSEGAGDGQLNLPWGVTVAPNCDVYVADWGNDRVQRFSPDGDFVAVYGAPGRGDGEFVKPSSVAVDGDGYMFVADWGNERVQVLDPEGGFVQKLRGEATDSKWAEDFLGSNVEEASARAKADLAKDIEFFNDDPHEESSHIEKYFWAPVSIKLDSDGRVYVTESNRHRLQVYERA